jgi:DNA polymerase III delta prime subunit
MVGRKEERARLKALLDAAREGRSGALLLHGPPGIGKTELLRYAVVEAQDFRLIGARGMESESDIPFAGLAELVTPLLAQLDEIPEVQATALRGALALGPATPADRFTVPAALLSLLARAADEKPVLAIVDDTQWLDEPSLEAFLFAGRRLGQEGVAMLGAIRDDATRLEVPWLDGLRVEPLPDGEARALLDTEIAPGVADRLIATAAGNPLALLEIPGLLSSGQLAGREPLEDPLRPGTGVERAFAVAIEALPDATRRALLVAAAASTRRLDAIGRGLSDSGLALTDFEPAEAAKIVTLADGELEFATRCCARPSTTRLRCPSAARRIRHSPALRTAPSAPGTSPPAPWRPTKRWRPRSSTPRWTPATAAPTRPRRAISAVPRSSRPRSSRALAGCWRRPATPCAARSPSAPSGCSTRPPA